METYDIILDSSGDLVAVDGDFQAGFKPNEMIRDIINDNIGEWKEFPLLGVGINQYLNTTADIQQITSAIKKALASDIFPDARVDLSAWPAVIFVDKDSYSIENN